MKANDLIYLSVSFFFVLIFLYTGEKITHMTHQVSAEQRQSRNGGKERGAVQFPFALL